MPIKILKMRPDDLQAYSGVPISFQVDSVFRLEKLNRGLGGIILREEKYDSPYIKDYDAARGEGPTRWLKRFDMTDWGIFMAYEDKLHIGGAIVAPGAYVGDLDSRFTQLFDIRLLPERRRQGFGSALLQQAADWSRERECEYLKIETQNTNVPACRFYAGQGAVLGNMDEFAYMGYPESEHEVRLVWYLKL